MSESLGTMGMEVSFPEVPDTDEAHEAYYRDAMERIRQGETVWVQRSFDSDSGRVLDLFHDKKYRGYIEQEYEDMACDVYLAEGEQAETRLLNYRRVSVSYAASMLFSAATAPETTPTRRGFGYHGH